MNIIGKSEVTAAQMAAYLISKNQDAQSWALEYATLYLEEGATEGVRGDGAWIQSIKETGWFKFTGGTAVTFDQNNFCGLGVTKKGMRGAMFSSPRLGIRAQIQHLKAYATSTPLKNQCIDPRYSLVSKGCAPTFEQLAGKWAVPGYDTSKASSLQDAMNKKIGYGFDIINGIEAMKKINVSSNVQQSVPPSSVDQLTKIKVAIDAGHGDKKYTAGKRTPDGYAEHWANVKVASYFAKAMDRCGVQYIKVGWNDDNATDDVDTPLTTRQQQIKNAKCDYSISFHFNASGDGKTYNSGEGIETLISDKSVGDSLNMANCVHKYLIQGTQQKNRGVKRQALSMCNCGQMGTKASILIECAFMTNKRESELMQSDSFCLECAEETAKGFCEYIGVKYISSGTAVPVKPVTPPTPSTSQPSSTTYTKQQFIKDVQSAIGAKVDGIAGPETLSKTPTISRTKNNRHPAVKPLQKYLNSLGFDCGTPDGIAGVKFDSGAKAFQRANNCTSDGEFTAKNKSWKKILGLE